MNNLIALSLFNTASSGQAGLGADLLAAWASARTASANPQPVASGDPNAPRAPWAVGVSQPKDEALVESALGGAAFFDTGAAQFADAGVEGDYARLFALHSGLKKLSALAEALEADKLNGARRTRLEDVVTRGKEELDAFFKAETFSDVRVALGDRTDKAASKLGVPVQSEDYITGLIHKGGLTDKLLGLDPNAQFDIVVTNAAGATQHVAIDLAEMGSLPRSLGSVVNFINAELASAGAATRLQTVNQAPKTTKIFVAGRTIEKPYVGPPLYALKVDARAGEQIAFEAAAPRPAFYVVGETQSGARLIKLEDMLGTPGEPVRRARSAATEAPISAAAGFLGAGAPYAATPAEAWERNSFALVDEDADTATGTEAALAAAGEAQITVQFADGRNLSVTTAWRDETQEAWRTRAGESESAARLHDLAERLTQLLHEQGVSAGLDVWSDGDGLSGLSLYGTDFLKLTNLTIGAKQITLQNGRAPTGGLDGGLRAGVHARRFEAVAVAGASALFTEAQTLTITDARTAHAITVDGGEDGLSAADLALAFNAKLAELNLPARVALVDVAGQLTLQVDSSHEISAVATRLNESNFTAARIAPGAWVDGGLPITVAGAPTADFRRTWSASAGAPLTALGNEGALDIAITFETGAGDKVVTVAVSALERAGDPDPAPGQWASAFQARLDEALNAAGIYAASDSLAAITIAEDSGQRLKSVVVNGVTFDYAASAPAVLGGAFAAQRTFAADGLATTTTDTLASLTNDPIVSLTLDTIWGERTVTASLEAGDPRTLESAALRLNEALAAAGYDVGVEAADLAVGAGLRIVAGASSTIVRASGLALGGVEAPLTLDAIDATSHADDPIGAAAVATRAARGAAAIATAPGGSTAVAPSVNITGWFPGRAFDVALGDGAKVSGARASAVGADGAIYVVADLENLAGDQPVKGARDVALLKYDSAGKLLYTRTLGAADEAQGFALAVAADGRVAIAGAIEGALSGAGAAGGERDSFVTVFDAEGREAWTARRGAKADDEAAALAFADTGALIVIGRTSGSLSNQTALGGADAYVRGYSTAGAELFTRQFGGAGADGATALTLRTAGDAIEITTGGVESTRGIIRQFTYSTTTGLSTGATRDLGAFGAGAAIKSLVIDGAALYVGGAVRADHLTTGGLARVAVAGLEGFVARISTDLGSAAIDRTTYLGAAGGDSISTLKIVGGAVYAAGAAEGAIAGAQRKGATDGFLARLDEAGDIAWLRNFNTSGGTLRLTSLAVDPEGVSALDVFGLPRGAVAARDSTRLIDLTALRVGDELSISVNEGRARRITISKDDTLASLASRLDQALGARGDARIVRDGEVHRIELTARRGDAIFLSPGREGRDALAALGVDAGVISIRPTPDSPGGKGEIRAFGLGLSLSDLKVGDKDEARKAKIDISAALSILRQAYDALADPASLDKTDAEKAREQRLNGAAPAHIQAQYANYRAALLRLGGLI